MENEIWLPVKGFEGIYSISNHGRIKSFKVNKEGRILVFNCKSGWYHSATLRDGKRVVYNRIHRLVANHFIPNPYNLPQVNHKDLNKQNNRVDNLEWVTINDNVRHAVAHKPEMLRGMHYHNKVKKVKTIIQLSLSGEFIAEYRCAIDAAMATGVCQRNISQVANQDEYKPGMTRKQAGGFIWRLKD